MSQPICDDEIEVLAVIHGKPWKRIRVKASSNEIRVPYFEGVGWSDYLGAMAPHFGQHILKPTGEKDEFGTPIWA